MKFRFLLKASVVCLLCGMLLAPAGVFAAGYQDTGGTATYQVITWYYTHRTVTDPSTPGPEVAFYEYSESNPITLFLGTHDCSQGGAGPMYQQSIGYWNPVHYYDYPTTFCLWTYSSSGSGSFSGEIGWD